MRPGSVRSSLLVASALTLGVAACGSSNKSSTPATTSVAPTTSPSTTAPAADVVVTVYLVEHEALVAVGRTVPGPAGPEAAVRALVAGPKGTLERDLSITSSIPAGTTVNGVQVADHAATVDVSKQFASGGGSQSMQARVAQVVFTVTQYPDVQRVRFALDGTIVKTIGGEGVMVDRIGRADVTNMLPAILVESPTVGATVTSPLHVRGTSNTFEATVNYTLTDPDGLILKEGVTTATAGTGTWGTFTFDVAFTVKRAGMGSLIVYDISPKDGTRENIREIPLQMQTA
jgi:hypothetical protein